MSNENDQYRHFILNQIETILPQRKIYTPQYFCLMLTMIIIGGTFDKMQKEQQQLLITPSIYEYILSIIAILIAFVVTRFSQFIGIYICIQGHRILYIQIYESYSIVYIVIHKYGVFQSAWILITTLRLMLISQIIIQIYGMWPQKFGRIFVELWLFYFIMRLIVKMINTYLKFIQDLSFWVLIFIIFINLIWLLCGYFKQIFMSIKDYKSPQTDNVLKDFGRLLCNIKIIVFTILIACAQLSLLILTFIQEKLQKSFGENYNTITNGVLPIISIVIVIKLVNLNYKPSFMMLISLISLVVCLLIILFIQQKFKDSMQLDQIAYTIIYFCYIVIFYLQRIYITPQYCQILLNIGIKNLDFASSYQFLAFGQIYVFYFYIRNMYKGDQLWIIILSFMSIVIILSIIFYQLLGFKRYMRNTNISQVEEDNLQIEIA